MAKRLSLTIVFCGLIGLLLAAAIDVFRTQAQETGDQQSAWQSLEIQSYRLVVVDASLWNITTLELWVENNRVQRLDASCAPGLILENCYLWRIDVSHYTIDGLFQIAQRAGDIEVEVEFDPQYHFPSRLFLNNPQAIDDERGLRVTAFEPLNAPADADGDLVATHNADLTAVAVPHAETTESASGAITSTPVYRQSVSLNSEIIGDDLNAAIERGAAAWSALGVDSYELEVSETGVWNAMHLALTVIDGRGSRLSARCDMGWMGGPCELWSFDPGSYTLPALFERAKQAAEVDWDWQDVLALDTTIGIPTMIFYDEELAADEEWQLMVTKLTLLEPPATSQP